MAVSRNRDDVEYLKNLPEKWWKNFDTIVIVGRTLDNYGLITDPWNFVTHPRAYQATIDEFVKEWKNG